MFRKILVVTAIATLFSTPVLAQQAVPMAPEVKAEQLKKPLILEKKYELKQHGRKDRKHKVTKKELEAGNAAVAGQMAPAAKAVAPAAAPTLPKK